MTMQAHWGWLATIDELARGERERWDYFLQMNLVEFFNEMAFRKDKKASETEYVLKLIKGKSADEATILILAHLANK